MGKGPITDTPLLLRTPHCYYGHPAAFTDTPLLLQTLHCYYGHHTAIKDAPRL